MWQNKFFRLSFIVLILSALAACNNGQATADADDDDASKEAPPIPVEVAATSRSDVFAVYSGTASLEAEEEALVIAKVGGEVVEIHVEEGDRVKAGQILAKLDGDRLRLEARQARANLAKLEQDFERNKDLHEQGLVSAGAYESLRYELAASKAAYNLASLELSYTDIKAPIDGVIAERFIKLGNTIDVNASTFQITDLEPLRAELHVPERELRKLGSTQTATIIVDALPGQEFIGTVARISPIVDPETGTFKTTIEIIDEQNLLKPGMFGRFNIVYDVHTQALLVPRVSIVDDSVETAVFIVEEGIAYRRVVDTGISRLGEIEVLSGLNGGEQVVVVGQTGLKDGAKVEIVGDLPTG
jgi:membrane fusion protein (multidrug efflux system)